MALFNVPANVKVDDFFKTYVPKQFSELTKGVDLSGMAGKELTVQFDIDGKKYCLKIKDGKNLTVIPGGIDKPVLCVALNEADWRAAVTGQMEGVIDRFADPAQAANPDILNTMLSTKGCLKVELKKPDGNLMPFSMVFNGETQPCGTIKLSLDNWRAMQKKETNGQNLFMAGQMQIDGDMMFLMSLNALL